ncbi:MAG: glycosyl hydrolase-related protein, partial [Opitutaceae bacterium]
TFPPAASASVHEGVLENDLYRVTVAGRGAITSLVDKSSGRELVQPVDGRAVNDLGPGDGTLEIENSGPVSVTLRAVSPAPLKHTSRITLYRDSRRIDIHNEIQENFGSPHTWSFAFKIDQPDVWHEEVGAVIRAKLLADGGHYSPRNARLDWLTLNHYVDVSNRGATAGAGVTLSNADCSFMRLGKSTLKELDASNSALSVLAGGDVSGIKLRILNQGGATYFLQRFALQPHRAFEPDQAMRFSLEHQNPLVSGRVAGGGRAYPEKSYSLLNVSRPGVFVWSVKPSEEGIERGMMVRVWNMAHEAVQAELACAQPVASAKQTTHLETDLDNIELINGKLPVTLAPQQIKTFRIMLPQR